TFLVDGTRAPREVEWFTNPDLARSLRLIAAQGPAALYGGELGQRIVTRLAQPGGCITLDDLREHRPEWVEPMSVSFKGHRVWELPPNNQGVAALEMLRLVEPYDLRAVGHNSAPYLHLLIEAKKLAFADAAHYVGDPTAMRTPATALLDDRFVAARRASIDPHHAAERPEPGAALTASETIYLTVADSAGDMVSFINSLFDAFGSGVVAPRFRHLDGRRVALEAPVGEPVRSALTALGHVIVDERAVAFGGAQAIMRLPRGYAAGSDPRKDGMAAGY